MRACVTVLIFAASAQVASAITILERTVSASGSACISQFDEEIGDMLFDRWNETLDESGALAFSDVASLNFGAGVSEVAMSMSGQVRPRGTFRLGRGCRSATVQAEGNFVFTAPSGADVFLDLESGPDYSDPHFNASIYDPSMQPVWEISSDQGRLDGISGLQTTLSPGTYSIAVRGIAGLSFLDQEDFGRDASLSFSLRVQDVAVPEPSTFFIACSAAFFLIARRLRATVR